MNNQIDTQDTTLKEYAEGPLLLDTILAGLSETELDLALNDDSWSIRQIVHHIADGDDIWKTCIKAALGNSDGIFTLQWYWDRPQMEWSENWRYTCRKVDSSLTLLNANRQHILELIQCIPNAWDKSILLKRPDGQEERIIVGDVLQMQARHVIGHIQDIQQILQAYQQRETS